MTGIGNGAVLLEGNHANGIANVSSSVAENENQCSPYSVSEYSEAVNGNPSPWSASNVGWQNR